MAGWRQAIELAICEEDLAVLGAIARSLWIRRRLKAASACRLRAIAVTSGPNSLSRLANAGLDPTISTLGLSQ
jgi:hypothetical protein